MNRIAKKTKEATKKVCRPLSKPVWTKAVRSTVLMDMPNLSSSSQTPASLMIDIHYARLGLAHRWTWARFTRLCRVINVTTSELASLVLMPHAWISRYKARKVLPGHEGVRRPIAMLLTILEAHVLSEVSSDIIKNPFPDLNNLNNPFKESDHG